MVVPRSSYAMGRQLASDPVVVVVDDFLSPEECAHLIGLASDRVRRSRVTFDQTVDYSPGRTGSAAWVPHDHTPTVADLVLRIGGIVDIPTDHAESLQIIHYDTGQQYKPHYDAWQLDADRGRQRTANGGQRLVTALMYLNRVDEGGATGFPKLGVSVEPEPGRLVLFHNTELDDGRHQRHAGSLHGGLPVDRGEKWACNLWFRASPYERPTRPGVSAPPEPGGGP